MKQLTPQPKLMAFILWSLWFMPLKMAAQVITLEHTYPMTDLHRLKLPTGGETWYYADDAAQQIRLFDSLHRPWKMVNYPKETNCKVSLAPMNLPVSQTTFKADNLLEFVWLFQDTTVNLKEHIKVLNERGDSIFSFPLNQTKITVDELINRPTKLFFEQQEANGTYSTTVYSLPNMVFEKTYPKASNFHRQIFGHKGEVYYFKNTPEKKLQIYDTNHNSYPPIPLAVPINGGSTYDDDPFFFADDKMFNTDDSDTSVKLVFSYYMKNFRQVRISTTPLFHSNSFSSFKIDRQTGQPDKLFFNYKKDSNSNTKYEVFSLPQMKKEVVPTPYESNITRILTKAFGAKYMTFRYGEINLFNNDHQSNRTINVVPSEGYNCFDSIPIICDTIVNRDTTLEIIFTERTIAQPYNYQLRITTKNGINLLTIPYARYYDISQLDNLETKLIVKLWNSDSARYTETQVWRFTARTAIQDPLVLADLDVQVSPNPFSTTFSIGHIPTDRPLSIRLFDAIGRLILSEKTNTTSVTLTPPSTMPQGVYLLELTDGIKRKVKRLVKIR
jgi:Secretion system C-terminal sorting domain